VRTAVFYGFRGNLTNDDASFGNSWSKVLK
jgi:hypothetical protein